MSRSTPIDEINRKLLMTIHQDGLLDVLAGLIIATFGMVPLLDSTGMSPGARQVIFLSCYVVEVLTIVFLKRSITLPRTGLVILSRRTSTRISVILLVVNILIFLLFLFSYLFRMPLWKLFGSYQLSVPLGLIFLVMLSAAGALVKAVRYYFYGILVLAMFVGAEHLFLIGKVENHGIPLASFLSGGLIVLSGGIHLRRFLRKYHIDRE
jgi:hypothetical protein